MGADTITVTYTPDTPGSIPYNSASGTAPVTVTNLPRTAPKVTVTPSASTITTIQSLSVAVTVSAGTMATPTGSVEIMAGNSTPYEVTLSAGAASFTIPANSFPAGADTITVTYYPDAVSSIAYSSSTGTAPVEVTFATSGTFEWTWMGGGDTVFQPATYGQLGTPALANNPGSRYYAASWTDANGHFWLFGGNVVPKSGQSGVFNDLWEHHYLQEQWYLFIRMGVDGRKQCGQRHRRVRQAGHARCRKHPGARSEAATCIDHSGHFWLFGGYGYDGNGVFGNLNDLWEFNPSTNEWTWMGGSSTASYNGQPGVYGKLGTPAAANVPAGRQNAAAWIDSSGNFWLFGGLGNDSRGAEGFLNDMWEFNPSTTQWTWMGGSSTIGPR